MTMMGARRLVGFLCVLGLMIIPHHAWSQDDDCLLCHGVEADMVDLDDSLRVDPAGWDASIHAEMGFGCVDCHDGKEEFPHEEGAAADCVDCHSTAGEEFASSIHGTIGREYFRQGSPCASCHGLHDVLSPSDERSPAHFTNMSRLCGDCHSDPEIANAFDIDLRVAENYRQSVHGQVNQEGRHAATCADCHGAHRTLRASKPDSRINPFRIVETCGSCHSQAAEDYEASIHGRAFERGVTASPVCTDCHGFHRILDVPDDREAARSARSARQTCPACHSNEALMGEFGVPTTRVSSYAASYHGLVNTREGDNSTVADCASCHGVHRILPSTHEDSRVAPWNLQETCGECHENASEEFTETSVHYEEEFSSSLEATITKWVRDIYWVLLFAVLGGMILHNIVILSWYIRRKWNQEKKAEVRFRFGRRQVFQHAVLIITFTLLVITGFMLAYPETWWSRLLVDMGVTESIRRWAHRVSAILMMISSIYHLWWIIFAARGRDEIRRMAPGIADVRHVIQNMRFHLGQTDQRPAFGKYDYPAKAEYWALVWGTVIMALTGLILWFPAIATSFLPAWTIKVSEVVHLFEAWLATLAILIFHLFYVIAHPDIYPLNMAMFSGKMPKEHAKHHHPAWEEGDEYEMARLRQEKGDTSA